MSSADPIYPNAKSKTSYQDGLEFQDFVCDQLLEYAIVLQNLASKKYQFKVGENLQGFEIKYDDYACACTKHPRIDCCPAASYPERIEDDGTVIPPRLRPPKLSIEVAEKSRDDPALQWTPSGILRNDNSWLYIQGNYHVLYIFAKRFLLNYYEKKKNESNFIVEKHGTIKTFYISNETARRHAAKVLEF